MIRSALFKLLLKIGINMEQTKNLLSGKQVAGGVVWSTIICIRLE